MDGKTNNIRIYLVNDKHLCNTIITMGFKYKCNWFVLQKLKKGQPCMCLELAHASENTALAYSIYEAIKEKTMGSAVEQSKSKVINIDCNYQNGEFLISFTIPNTLSALKRTLSTSLSKFTPQKYYKKYTHNIKLLNGKPYKEEFIHCCNLLNKTKIQFFVIGKINIDRNKFTEMLRKSDEKYKKIKITTGGKQPYSISKNQGRTDYPIEKADGYKAVFLRDFIKNTFGLPVVVNSGEVIIYNSKWPTISKKIDKKLIDKHINKYTKLKEQFTEFILYKTSLECLLDTDNLIKLYKDKPRPSILSNIIVI